MGVRWAIRSRCCIVKAIVSQLTLHAPFSAKVFSAKPFYLIGAATPQTHATVPQEQPMLNPSDPTPTDQVDETSPTAPSGAKQPAKAGLPVESAAPTPPAFGCIVYFACDGGVFRGRVANLAEIEVSASSQREMLGQIVARFKSSVAASLDKGETPAWIVPPAEKRPGETKLFLPVHL